MLDNRAILFTLLVTKRLDMRQTHVDKQLMLDTNANYHKWHNTDDNSKIFGFYEVQMSMDNFIDKFYFNYGE